MCLAGGGQGWGHFSSPSHPQAAAASPGREPQFLKGKGDTEAPRVGFGTNSPPFCPARMLRDLRLWDQGCGEADPQPPELMSAVK